MAVHLHSRRLHFPKRGLTPFLAKLVVLSWTVAVSQAVATAEDVFFDVEPLVTCRSVEASDTRFAPPEAGRERLEAFVRISSLIAPGKDQQLVQMMFVIESPHGRLQFVDYDPKTELVSQLEGNVQVRRQQERSANAGLSVTAKPDSWVSGGGTAGLGSKDLASFQYEMLPPKKMVSASGTIARASAVFFKLQPTQQTTLEGVRTFRVVFEVPTRWRADFVRVRCVAYQRAGDGRDIRVAAKADFSVGLYRMNDLAAREAADAFVQSERRLRQLAAKGHSDRPVATRKRPSTWTRTIGHFFGDAKPAGPPRDWLLQVLMSDPGTDAIPFAQRLPQPAREAVREYLDQRHALLTLEAAVVEPK